MADLPVNKRYDVPVPKSVRLKMQEVKIQEFKSRIVRMRQDIDDLINGQVKKLEGELEMLQKTLKLYEMQYQEIKKQPDVLEIDVK